MAEWEMRYLGDIAQLTMGQSPRGSLVKELESGLPFLQGNGEFGARFPMARFECDDAPRRSSPGDSLISVRAPVGDINRSDRGYGIGRGLAAVAFKSVDSDFGHYALIECSRHLDRISQGTTFSAIGRTELATLQLPVPPLWEQRWIAEILDTIDETIQATERVIAKRKRIRAGIAAGLLSGRSVGAPTKDCKANKGPGPLASARTSKSWDVVEWQETCLGLVARHFRGYSYSSAELSEDGDDFISLKVFDKGGGFRVDGVKSIDAIVPQRFRVPAGAVLIANTDLTRDGDVVGTAAVVPQQFDGAVFSMDATRCVPDSDLLDDRFLALALGTPEVRAFMRGISAGSTVLHLDTKRLDQVPLLLPPLEEQWRIADILDTIDETIQVEETQADKLRRLRSGLAADLLSGRVRTERA